MATKLTEVKKKENSASHTGYCTALLLLFTWAMPGLAQRLSDGTNLMDRLSSTPSLPSTGLLASYDFTKYSGASLLDQSGNGNNGVLVNSPAAIPGGLQFVAGSSQSASLPSTMAAATTTSLICGDFTATYALSGSSSSTFHPIMGSFSMPGAGLQIALSDNLINANQGPVNGRIGTFSNASLSNESADSAPEFRPTCLTVVWNSSISDDIYVDGQHVSLVYATNGVPPTTGSASVAHGSQFALMGNPSNGQFASGNLYFAAQWSGQLSAAQVYQATEYARSKMRANGVNLLPANNSTANNCVVVGDSRSAGATTNPYPYLLSPASDTFTPCYNFGINAQSTFHMLAQAGGGPISAYRPLAKRNVFVIWGCLNNFFNPTVPSTPQQCVDSEYQALQLAKKAGFQTVIMDEISTGATQAGSGLTADQLKNQVNAIVRATWHGNADMFVDLGADPNLGCDGCYSNSYFQGDSVHPSQTGQNRIAALLSNVIDAGASGSQVYPQKTISATYTATVADDLIRANTASSGFTVTLPSAVGITGKRLTVKNIGSNSVTLAASGSQLIDGAGTMSVIGMAPMTLQSNGSGWDALSPTAAASTGWALSYSPSTNTVADGFTSTYAISQSAAGGYAGTVTYSASSLPSGVSGSFSPTTITGSGTSTLTLTATGSAPAYTGVFNLSGTDGSVSHSATPGIVVSTLPSGLVERWTMNEGTGSTFTDSTSNANTMTASGVTWRSTTGVPGSTAYFNGSAYADGANQIATNFSGSSAFSISTWATFDATGNVESLISTLDATNNYIGYELSKESAGSGAGGSANQIEAFLINSFPSNNIHVYWTFTPAINTLYNLLLTYDGSKTAAGTKLYVNGVAQAVASVQSDTLTGTIANTKPVRLADRIGGGSGHAGVQTDTRFWSRAHTSGRHHAVQ